MDTAEIINHVSLLTDIKSVQDFAASVFDSIELYELDNAVLDAMDSRMAELYVPSAKEAAQGSLTVGYALFKKYDSNGNRVAAARQARKCKKMQTIYDSL